MKRFVLTVAALATLAAPAAADARLSTARAELEARRAVAPLDVKAVACFRIPVVGRRRARVERQVCVVDGPAPAGDRCVATVMVTKRSRPRRVRAKVTIPLRCFPEWPQIGPQGTL